MTTSSASEERPPTKHPRAFEPLTLIVTIALSVLGAIIGVHLITTLGISANTSVIGAVIAMLLGRITFFGFAKFRSRHRQNLVQSAVSAATFAAANGLLAPIAIPWAMGRPELVWPMLLGASLGVLIDVFVLFKAFGSKFLPASAAWPPGVAAAETIRAGSEGGRRALILVGGGVVGVIGSLFALPMSAAGVALIGNMWALLMFAVGLLISQYAPVLLDVDLGALYIPHGVMIGAGLVALLQVVWIIVGARTKRQRAEEMRHTEAIKLDETLDYSVSRRGLGRALGGGYIAFVIGALLIALIGGAATDLSIPALIGFVLFAGFAAIVHELIVGLAAMHAGWFPAFAVTLIFLVLGLFLQMPEVPLLVLVAYCSATGPAFADMGYDYKAGWILRREGRPWKAYELAGRREQLKASLVAIIIAIGVVAVSWQGLFGDGKIPPSSKVFADTIAVGISDPQVILTMALWAIPGALVQLLGGSKRQMGVLLATGLLVATANAGWLVLAALLFRVIWMKYRGAKGEQEIALMGAGVIAADSLMNVGKIIKF
ncbi:OPT/YSL family transporter [Microbacterium sp. AK031]|uniref:OPT/YSL family transporter n=1 Tax=Microbacterium sp. AK031 TaxID=2723076 RepID=UPI002167D1FF|nr:OPT/YSL family transporter [Microbacterium sp. AK031]MCS3841915.1 putative oligopeptide transporter (OPT) family protein [Microbacterium sp. AK031]